MPSPPSSRNAAWQKRTPLTGKSPTAQIPARLRACHMGSRTFSMSPASPRAPARESTAPCRPQNPMLFWCSDCPRQAQFCSARRTWMNTPTVSPPRTRMTEPRIIRAIFHALPGAPPAVRRQVSPPGSAHSPLLRTPTDRSACLLRSAAFSVSNPPSAACPAPAPFLSYSISIISAPSPATRPTSP